MKEVILGKYGELALKGLNKSHFEAILTREIKERLAPLGEFSVTRAQSTVYIEPQNEAAERAVGDAFYEVQHVFGITAVARAAVAEKDMDSILRTAKDYVPQFLYGAKTFKAEAKRSDKKFPLTSPEISAAVGRAICEVMRAHQGRRDLAGRHSDNRDKRSRRLYPCGHIPRRGRLALRHERKGAAAPFGRYRQPGCRLHDGAQGRAHRSRAL